MPIKSAFILAFLFLSSAIFGQRLERKHKMGNTTSTFGIFLNTLSLLEPQQGAIGVGINYKISPRWDISAEANYLFEGFWQGGDDYTIDGGYRGIITVKRFSKTRVFFYGIDLRIKHFSFSDKQHFANALTHDTLFNFRHDANNTLLGAAAIVGVRLPISKNKKWAFEINTGYGTKYRFVKRKNIPAGYMYYRGEVLKLEYNFTIDQDVNSADNIYFPTTVRILYFF